MLLCFGVSTDLCFRILNTEEYALELWIACRDIARLERASEQYSK